MARYLITGGAGFIGSNFVRYVFEREPGAYIRVLDKLTYSGNLNNLKDFRRKSNFEFIKGDICDEAIVRRAMKNIHVVVNFAAEVAVDRSINAPEEFLQTDIFGVYRLLTEARRQTQLKKLVQISTDEVYGHIHEGSFTELSSLNPRNPYAASKLGGDRLAFSFYETFGVPVVISRASNNYGPWAYPEKVIPLFITNLMDDLPVPLYGKGAQIRDWLFVEDHCAAILLLIQKGKNGEVYNVGGEQECTNLELTNMILKAMGKDQGLIKFVQDRPGHDFRYSLDCRKLRSLGWRPKKSLEEGLLKTIRWYEASEDWWRPLKKKMERRYVTGFWGEKK